MLKVGVFEGNGVWVMRGVFSVMGCEGKGVWVVMGVYSEMGACVGEGRV